MKSTTLLAFLIFILLTPVLTQAAIINVPSEQPTIQAGIDASSDGDVVLLTDGTYTGRGNFQINFNGKSITVKSANGPDVCIVDCQGISRGFLVYNGETVTLEGLTVTNGDARENEGGAINLGNSTLHAINCIFENNSAYDGGSVCSWDSSFFFTNCTFTDNSAVFGGAVRHSGSIFTHSFTNCTFTRNSGSKGGAVYSSSHRSSYINCTFTFN